MKGFTDKAIILFPSINNYRSRPDMYKYQFRTALVNLVQYLQQRDITPHVLYTDDVAREYRLPEFVYISPVGKQELFFMKRYCNNAADAIKAPTIFYNEEYNRMLDKIPLNTEDSNEVRFAGMVDRIGKMSTIIIRDYKAVFHFVIPSKRQYSVRAKEGDGRIIVEINAGTFLTNAYMNGIQQNPIDLFGLNCASRSLDMWEVT